MSDVVHGAAAERWGGWEWRKPTRGEHFRRCSHCGSIHPEDLAEALSVEVTIGDTLASRGRRVEWADMKYGWPHKFYIDIPNRKPSRLFVVGSISGGDPGRPLDAGYVPWGQFNRQQKKAVADYRFGDHTPRGVMFGTRDVHHAKFYSVHLADPAISDEVKEAIYAACGLTFEWLEDGKVRWRQFAP
jgi:hypothetical protein